MAVSRITSDFSHRFGGIQRLVGSNGAETLRAASVCVVGIGGVGSWAAEALARSGVGSVTLVDWDDICITNVNRQIHAVNGTIGQSKVSVLSERISHINPACDCRPVRDFLTARNIDSLLAERFDYVIDAIDQVNEKCLMINHCRHRKWPVISVGGAGGRLDPTAIRVDDMSRSRDDPLLARVRKMLRRDYGFPRNPKRRFRVPCVYSAEAIRFPQPDGSVCYQRSGGHHKLRLDCEHGYGAASFVTGAFGFAAAAHIIAYLTRKTAQ